MEHAYREITAYSESQELIITLCVLLEYEETTCTARTEKSYAWREIMDDALAANIYNIRDGIADALIDLDALSNLLR